MCIDHSSCPFSQSFTYPFKFTAKSTMLWYLFSLLLGNMQFKCLPSYWLSWLMFVVALVHLQTNAGIIHDTQLKTESRHTASLAATAWLTHCCMYLHCIIWHLSLWVQFNLLSVTHLKHSITYISFACVYVVQFNTEDFQCRELDTEKLLWKLL
jgi:hypothetical protein